MHERQITDLEEVSRPVGEARGATSRLLTLDYGLALHRAAVQWYLDEESPAADDR